MLAAERYLYHDGEMPSHELLEIRRSKISLHHAKEGYSYPTIRLPYELSQLAGLSTRIYQTVHEGALAFVVVVSSANVSRNTSERSKNNGASAKASAFTRRRSPVRIRPSPSSFSIRGLESCRMMKRANKNSCQPTKSCQLLLTAMK
jgi:hypothetical protein